MQVDITLFSKKRQGAFISAGVFIGINMVSVLAIQNISKPDLLFLFLMHCLDRIYVTSKFH